MRFVILVLLMVYVGRQSAEESRILYNTVRNCKSNEFYEINAFTCQLCDAANGLKPTLEKLSCQCDDSNSTILIDYDNLSQLPICDNSRATPTQNTTANFCPIKHLKLTTSNSVQTQHVQILTDLWPNCTSCNVKTSVVIRNFDQDYCVAKPLVNDMLGYNSYRPSSPVFENLTSLTFFCQTMKETKSCHRLANLCALSQYGVEKFSPCSLFYASSQTTQQAHDNSYSQQVSPVVFYRRSKDSMGILDKILDQRYETELNSEKNQIHLHQTRFDVLGNVRTMQSLSLNDLNMCLTTSGSSNYIQFGKNIGVSCRVSIVHLMAEAERYGAFMDVYLNHTTENEKAKFTYLVPVPVLVRGVFKYNQVTSDRDYWQLVQRIVLVDTFTDADIKSTRDAASTYSHLEDLQRLKSIRYINYIELKIRMAEDHNAQPNRISTPLLIVDYGHLNTSSILTSDDGAFVNFTFKVEFTKEYDMQAPIQVILPILLALGLVCALLKTARYKKRQQRQFYDVDIFGKFLVYLVGHAADAIFACSSIICIYLLTTIHNQTVVRVILPIEDHEMVSLFLYIAVPMKFLAVMHQLWMKCNIDIFFVDWERPKAFDNHTIVKNNIETPSICSGGKMLMYEGVSAWRSFFVANEWLKLITQRRSSIRVQMIVVICVILAYLTGCPGITPTLFSDPTMKLALALALYFMVYLTQRLIHAAVFERYFSNSVQRFVDICSLANVSLFVLQLETFGYYVHGRSPHGFSDTDMCSMTVQLKREEQNTFDHRGLILNSDQQTFIMLLPQHLRVLYDRLINATDTIKSNESPTERIAAAYYNINRFLSAFIDHGLKDMDYMIQEKSILQRIGNLEDPNHCSESRGVFYSDTGHSFANVLFHGNEFNLFSVEIMVFALVGNFTGDYLIAMLFVGALNRLIRIVFGRLMKRNLSKKSLIDSRFLL